MAILSMTRLQLKSISLLPKFFIQNEAIVKQIASSKGFIKDKTLADFRLGMWTTTLWNSEEDLRAFYTSGAHLNLMPSLDFYSSEAVTARMIFEYSELPTWSFVHEQLSKTGKFSSVLKEPTQNHINQIILPPKCTFFTRPIKPKN